MRDRIVGNAKATLRQWFADKPSDYLARVVDECRAGVFCYGDACHCLLGLLEADASKRDDFYYDNFSELEVTTAELTAEDALLQLAPGWEHTRRNRALPIVLAEIRRRSKVAQPASPVSVEVGA